MTVSIWNVPKTVYFWHCEVCDVKDGHDTDWKRQEAIQQHLTDEHGGLNPVPIRWDMYSTGDGDQKVTAQMNNLTADVRKGHVTRQMLPNRVKDAAHAVTEVGYGEVHDTEPEWAITHWVNVLCDEQGWKHFDRWDLF